MVLRVTRNRWNVGTSTPTTASLDQEHPTDRHGLLYAEWMTNPQASDQTALAFVEDFSVFYVPDVGAEVKKVYPLSDVTTVEPEVVIHGVPDWLYEGELLQSPMMINFKMCRHNDRQLSPWEIKKKEVFLSHTIVLEMDPGIELKEANKVFSFTYRGCHETTARNVAFTRWQKAGLCDLQRFSGGGSLLAHLRRQLCRVPEPH